MESLAKLKPDFYKEFKDKNSGLSAFVVIDRCVNGFATGGIRMAGEVTLEEIANLAHEMTMKFAFLNIKKDGAKAGIVAHPKMDREKKKELCLAFGREIRGLIKEGKYSPGEDLGINSEDLSNIFLGAGINYLASKEIDSGYFTALTVFLTAEELLKHKGEMLKGLSVTIEGFGKVGEKAAKLFSNAGSKIIGISTLSGGLFDPNGLDIQRLCSLKKEYGDSLVNFYPKGERGATKDLILQKTDLLIPGARADCINLENINQIKARIIIPISNIAATEAVEHQLFEKGITYIPGFVSNCGGILSYFLNEGGFDKGEVEKMIREGFSFKIKKILKETNRQKAFSEVARRLIAANLGNMSRENKLPRVKKAGVKRLGWFAHRKLKGTPIGFIFRPFARQYLRTKIFS